MIETTPKQKMCGFIQLYSALTYCFYRKPDKILTYNVWVMFLKKNLSANNRRHSFVAQKSQQSDSFGDVAVDKTISGRGEIY
jgi:hypothetical protein